MLTNLSKVLMLLKNCFVTPTLSQVCSKRSAFKQESNGLFCVTNEMRVSILASAAEDFPQGLFLPTWLSV